MTALADIAERIRAIPTLDIEGYVTQVTGTVIHAILPGVSVGTAVVVDGVGAEVVGFHENEALLVPLDHMAAIAHGTPVTVVGDAFNFPVGDELLGRIVDPIGRPMDGKPEIGGRRISIHAEPPEAMKRRRIARPVSSGIRAIDALVTLAEGQRIAIMAGTGVGKSTLLGMIARFSDVDVVVAALVGERGREVREFLEDQLGEGLARSVVVVATSDRPAVLQVRAVTAALAVAEHFRDKGKRVLLLVDSITRLAMAQRQIGLGRGEPPTTRGYTPSVFSLIPSLLERAGLGEGAGSITAVFTVLVEGDDLQDPIADLVRGVVDGHVVLSRKLADRGHFPAIDVLRSLSRTMPAVVSATHGLEARQVRRMLSIWEDNEELVRLGAYRKGTDPAVDRALFLHPRIEAFLTQQADYRAPAAETARGLAELGGAGA